MDAQECDPQVEGIEQVITESLSMIKTGLESDGIDALRTHIIEPGLVSVLSESQRMRLWRTAKRLSDHGAQSVAQYLACVCDSGTSGFDLDDLLYLVAFGQYSNATALIRDSTWSLELKVVSYAYVLDAKGLLERFVAVWGDTWRRAVGEEDLFDSRQIRDMLLGTMWLRARLKGKPLVLDSRMDEQVQRTLKDFDGALSGTVKMSDAQKSLKDSYSFYESDLGTLLVAKMSGWLHAVDLVVNSCEVEDESIALIDSPIISADRIDSIHFPNDEWKHGQKMIDHILLGSEPSRLVSAAIALREGDYILADSDLSTMTERGPLTESLRLYLLVFLECSKEEPLITSEEVRSRLTRAIRYREHVHFASYLSVQQAYVLLLLREGRVDRARSELSILVAKLNHNDFNLYHSVRFFGEAITIFEAAREGRALPSFAVDGAPQHDGLYAQLRHEFRNIGSTETGELVSRIFPPVGIIRELCRLRLTGDYTGYVKYSGQRCDDLIRAKFKDTEFIFSIRLDQAIILERLGRLDHAVRVSKYVHERSTQLGLSDRLRISSSVLYTRLLLALGSYDAAVQQIEASSERAPLSSSEIYVLSMSYEALGRVDDALRALRTFLSRGPGESTYRLLGISEQAVRNRLEGLVIRAANVLVNHRLEQTS